MKRVLLPLAMLLLCGALEASAAERYTVEDRGGFGATGRHVEFASRYGWRNYAIDFDFGLDMQERKLTPNSVLKLTIERNDGSSWSYKCRAKDSREMWANVNQLYGKGVSVLTECRLAPVKFGRAVELDADMVGEPTLVFHVMIRDGKAVAGIQKGLYFLAGGEMEVSPIKAYSSRYDDPSNLGVLFASALAPYPYHPHYALTPRYLP